MTRELSLVTGTLDRPASLQRLMLSIIEHTSVNWELIIVDASTNPFVFVDIGKYDRVQVIHENPRQGMTKGYNMGFRAARGKWVLWLNDDAEVQPDYDTEAVSFMESHPEIGLGALYYREDPWLPKFSVNAYLGMVYANFGILSKELGDSIGWFDEDLTMYGSDNSISFRVLKAGKGIASIPGAKIVHHSEKDAHRNTNKRGQIRDNQILWQKYHQDHAAMKATYDKFALEHDRIRLPSKRVLVGR